MQKAETYMARPHGLAVCGAASLIGAPGASRDWPSVTTFSACARPEAIAATPLPERTY